MKKIIVAIATLAIASIATADTNTAATAGEYGGNCAMGVTMGKMVHTDCSISWKDPTSSKTYCFSSEEMKTKWAENTTSNIEKANTEYTKLNKQG